MTKTLLPLPARRVLHLRRRPLAALAAFAATLLILLTLAPPAEPGVVVYAARTSLPAGTVLAPELLTTVTLPPRAVPVGAVVDAAEATGRTLAGPVAEGSALTATAIGEGQRLARPGHVVVALPLSDAAIADLVRPGVRLDVLDDAGTVVAADVPVVTPPETTTGRPWDLGGSARSVLVEVPHEVAATLTARGPASLTVAVR